MHSLINTPMDRKLIPVDDFIQRGIDAAFSQEGPLVKAIIINQLEVRGFNFIDGEFDKYNSSIYSLDSENINYDRIESTIRKGLSLNKIYSTFCDSEDAECSIPVKKINFDYAMVKMEEKSHRHAYLSKGHKKLH